MDDVCMHAGMQACMHACMYDVCMYTAASASMARANMLQSMPPDGLAYMGSHDLHPGGCFHSNDEPGKGYTTQNLFEHLTP